MSPDIRAILSLADEKTSLPRFLILLASRILLASAFLYSGADKTIRWSAGEQEIAAIGLPLVSLLHVVTVVVQIGAGLSVVFGLQARFGALALCLLLVPITALYHPFWLATGPSFVAELNHFLLNLGLLGGLLMVVVYGAESPTGSARLRRRKVSMTAPSTFWTTCAPLGPSIAIGVELDLHCQIGKAALDLADITICYKEYPHTDIIERAREVYRLTRATAEGRVRPTVGLFDRRMVGAWRTIRQPMSDFVRWMQASRGTKACSRSRWPMAFPGGGGAPGDSTFILQRLIERGARDDALGCMVAEAFDQLARSRRGPLTHIFVQGGVGVLAAAVCAHAGQVFGADAPIQEIVEPERADCLFQSAMAGAPTKASGDRKTIMAGCPAVKSPNSPGASIIAGESAGAGLADLMLVAADPDAKAELRLDRQSRVLLFDTEGATDRGFYTALMAPEV